MRSSLSPFRGLDEAEKSFNVYGDPEELHIISDEDEDSDETTYSFGRRQEKEESFTVRLQKAASVSIDVDDESITSSATHVPTTSSPDNDPSQNGNLAGILEVSKFFIHDNCADHDAEIECGVASGLSTLLRRSLFLYEQARNNESKKHSSKYMGSGLEYIASLSTSLSMVLHCSTSVLEDHVDQFQSGLIADLQSMAKNFASDRNGGDAVLVQIVLTNLCRIISLIHGVLPGQAETLLEILCSTVNGESVASDVKVNAAGRVCDVIENYPLDIKPQAMEMIERHASVLISVISTASSVKLSEGKHEGNDPTLRLYDLAEVSDRIRVKIMKRRCAVLCITRHFRHTTSDVRRKAYSFCQEILDRDDVSNNYFSGILVENALVKNLAECASAETDPDIQLLACSLLRSIIKLQPFPSASVMAAIRNIACSGQSDKVVMESGAAFCHGMKKEPFPTLENISTVVNFTSFPFANIRTEAFETLEALLTKTENVEMLLNETEVFETFAAIVSHGEDDDCEAVLNIVRQLARSSRNHSNIRQNSAFVGVLVDFVATNDITNRNTHFYGIEIILALLSNDENTASFLPFRHLLPWLVNFLNKTTADDSFKEQLVAVILRLSTAYLEQEI